MVTLTCSRWIELPRSSAARSNGCCMDAILDEGWSVARMERSAIRETFAWRALAPDFAALHPGYDRLTSTKSPAADSTLSSRTPAYWLADHYCRSRPSL